MNSLQELHQLIAIPKEMNIERISIVENAEAEQESKISQRDKSIDPSELFGIWQNKPKILDDIRKEG